MKCIHYQRSFVFLAKNPDPKEKSEPWEPGDVAFEAGSKSMKSLKNGFSAEPRKRGLREAVNQSRSSNGTSETETSRNSENSQLPTSTFVNSKSPSVSNGTGPQPSPRSAWGARFPGSWTGHATARRRRSRRRHPVPMGPRR